MVGILKPVVIFLLTQLIDHIAGSQAVARIRAAIGRWSVAAFKPGTPVDDANAEKREGVVREIVDWAKDPDDPMPSYITESWARWLTESVYRLFKWEKE